MFKKLEQGIIFDDDFIVRIDWGPYNVPNDEYFTRLFAVFYSEYEFRNKNPIANLILLLNFYQNAMPSYREGYRKHFDDFIKSKNIEKDTIDKYMVLF